MKLNIIQFAKVAKCTALLLLAGAAWSCSSNDEVEEMLSKETTPVTFLVDAMTTPIFFDYTEGWRYIGSDTVKSTSSKTSVTTLNLHQGKHNIIAVKGVSTSEDVQATCIHFNPDAKTFSLQTIYKSYKDLYGEDYPYDEDMYYESANRNDAFYWHRQLEVSPYLLPEQQPDFQPVTATLRVTVTDYNNKDIMPGQIFQWSGFITDIPVVEEVGIENNKFYKLRKKPHQWNVGLSRQGEYGMYPSTYQHITLCPLEGLHDITLSCTMTDEHGQAVPTTPLPAFSLRRGYTTVLRGPLFSGSAYDWTVEMQPYE